MKEREFGHPHSKNCGFGNSMLSSHKFYLTTNNHQNNMRFCIRSLKNIKITYFFLIPCCGTYDTKPRNGEVN